MTKNEKKYRSKNIYTIFRIFKLSEKITGTQNNNLINILINL